MKSRKEISAAIEALVDTLTTETEAASGRGAINDDLRELGDLMFVVPRLIRYGPSALSKNAFYYRLIGLADRLAANIRRIADELDH